mgnify:CR=1 FL=1
MTDDPYQREAKWLPLSEGSVELTREQVEFAAEQFGPGSNSAQALKRADEHNGPVRFWFSPKDGLLSLELLEGKDPITNQ